MWHLHHAIIYDTCFELKLHMHIQGTPETYFTSCKKSTIGPLWRHWKWFFFWLIHLDLIGKQHNIYHSLHKNGSSAHQFIIIWLTICSNFASGWKLAINPPEETVCCCIDLCPRCPHSVNYPEQRCLSSQPTRIPAAWFGLHSAYIPSRKQRKSAQSCRDFVSAEHSPMSGWVANLHMSGSCEMVCEMSTFN